MHEDQADDDPAAAGVPAGQHVGADAAFQRRGAGHQGQQHDDGVPGQHAADVRQQDGQLGRADGVKRDDDRPSGDGQRTGPDRCEQPAR